MSKVVPNQPLSSLNRILNVAPMMGCTDRHCRYLLRLMAPGTLIYTEMVVASALVHGDTDHFLAHHGDAPCALQVGGSDPQQLAQIAPLIETAGYQEINLNVGCPSDRVQYGGIGACLMATPGVVADCIAAMQSAVSIPVTVKCRIGIDQSDSYENFRAFVDTVAQSGCQVFIVHARKAILKGLSPRDNRKIPPLRYDYVRRIKQELPDLTFVLNGECQHHNAVSLLREVDGLMYGRSAYNDPWMLARLDSQLFSTTLPPREEVMEAYLNYMSDQLDRGVALKHMARHLLGFYAGCKGARKFRRLLSEGMFSASADVHTVVRAIQDSGVTSAPLMDEA